MQSRQDSLALLEEWVENPGLRNHMKAVEAAMRYYARKFDEDEEIWGQVGLLHDLDWERYPDEHPLRGADELRRQGYPEEVVRAVLAHRPDFTGVEPESLMERTLMACDELTGLIVATALVRPNRLQDLKPKSVKKKMKDRAFAAAVSRDEIRHGTELLGVDLNEHIANVVAAMREIEDDLGLGVAAG